MLWAYSTFNDVTLMCSIDSIPTPDTPVTTPAPTFETPLSSGQEVTYTLRSGEAEYFRIIVPAGATAICSTDGNNGDADLYIKFGSTPTQSDFDMRGWNYGSVENVGPTAPRSTDEVLFVMLWAYSTFNDVTLMCSINI